MDFRYERQAMVDAEKGKYLEYAQVQVLGHYKFVSYADLNKNIFD